MEQALERIEGGSGHRGYDLLLLDVMLPGVDGLEVAARLRKAGRMLSIVLISARGRTADAIAGLDAGADDYVTKPFDLDEVIPFDERVPRLLQPRASFPGPVWPG